MTEFVKPIEQWSDEEIDKKVRGNLIVMVDTDGKGLTQQEKDFDGELKKEYWRREKLGLHVEIECMICTNPQVTFYDIMKQFCSDMKKVANNICAKHYEDFDKKGKEFLQK